MMNAKKEPALFYRKVYAVVNQIPPGLVTSYGRIAEMLGATGAARQVGYAMSALKSRDDDPAYQDVPWHRVVGHDGQIVIKGPGPGRFRQAELLREEGVIVNEAFKVNMETHIWDGLLPHEVDHLLQGL